MARIDQRLFECYLRGPDQTTGGRVMPFHPQPCMQGPAIIFGVNRQSSRWGMEPRLELLWVPSENFDKPERSHWVEGSGSLDAGETC